MKKKDLKVIFNKEQTWNCLFKVGIRGRVKNISVENELLRFKEITVIESSESKILKESRIEESNSILKNFFENKVEDTKLKNKILSKDLNENLIIENAKKNIKEKLKYLGEDEELILKNRNSIGFISNSKKQNTTIYEKGKKHNEQKIEDEFYKSMRNRIFKKV